VRQLLLKPLRLKQDSLLAKPLRIKNLVSGKLPVSASAIRSLQFLINDVPFTKMTPAKVKTLVAGMKANKSVHQLIGKLGDGNNALGRIHSEVENNIRVKGPVFFAISFLDHV
jgi:hypothetical protein